MTDIQGKSLNGVQMTQTEKTSSIQVEGLSTLQISNDTLFQKTTSGVQNTFADMIIFLLSIFLVWYLIKWSLTTGEGPGQELMGKMTGFIQEASKSLPIFGWFSANQVGTMRTESKKKTLRWLHMNERGEFDENKAAFTAKINTLMGVYDSWSDRDQSTLNAVINNNWDFFAESQKIGAQRHEWLSLSVPQWKTALEKWLKIQTNARWSFGDTYTDFKEFFDTGDKAPKHRLRLHELMGGENAIKNHIHYSDSSPIPYDKFISNTYSQPTDRRTAE